MAGFTTFNTGDPWASLSTSVWGLGFIAVTLALFNSAIAGSNASSIATTRVGYSLARIRMLPRALTRIHPRFETPSVAVHVQAAFAISYALILGFALGDPLKALVLQGTISTLLIVGIYICTGVSCAVFYLREHRSEFNPILHLLVPLTASAVFIPVLLAAFGVDFAGLGIQPLASPANFAPYVVYAWMALGVVVLIYFSITDRSRIAATRHVFVEQPEPDAQASGGRVRPGRSRSPAPGTTGARHPQPPAGARG
jgi:amino acid transporter